MVGEVDLAIFIDGAAKRLTAVVIESVVVDDVLRVEVVENLVPIVVKP